MSDALKWIIWDHEGIGRVATVWKGVRPIARVVRTYGGGWAAIVLRSVEEWVIAASSTPEKALEQAKERARLAGIDTDAIPSWSDTLTAAMRDGEVW